LLDLLIKEAHIFPEGSTADLAIKEGKIVKVAREISAESKNVIHAKGNLVIPGFVDIHTHLEKALTFDKISNNSGTLLEAIENFVSFFEKVTEEDIYQRATKVLHMALSHGTTALRSHVTIDTVLELKALHPILKLKEDWKDYLTIQVVAFPAHGPEMTKEIITNFMEQAAELGVDVLGGCPSLVEDHLSFIDLMFNLAKRFNLPLDFHVDESDEPDARALEYLAEKTIAVGYEGKVTAGHCCSLAAVDDNTAKRVINKVKKAGISIVALPSCNLFLMGRGDNQPIRRGVTRIKEFIQAGVNLSYSSDNIRDPFRPFGNANLLEEGLLTAQVAQMGGQLGDFDNILKMGTYNPAKAMALTDYGLTEGCHADLVVLAASSPTEAIINNSTKLYVLKKGKVVAKNSFHTELVVD
jgi:cytosine deaminase